MGPFAVNMKPLRVAWVLLESVDLSVQRLQSPSPICSGLNAYGGRPREKLETAKRAEHRCCVFPELNGSWDRVTGGRGLSLVRGRDQLVQIHIKS